jgi:hypothetical protein
MEDTFIWLQPNGMANGPYHGPAIALFEFVSMYQNVDIFSLLGSGRWASCPLGAQNRGKSFANIIRVQNFYCTMSTHQPMIPEAVCPHTEGFLR